MRFHERLRKLRLERNLSMKQLANRMSVPKSDLSKWELGKEYPTEENINKLAKAFHVKIRELITEEDDIRLQRLRDNCISKKYYLLSLVFLALTVLFAGLTKVAFEAVFKVLTVLAFIGFVFFSIYSKPQYEREEKARKNKIADVVSKMAVAGILFLVMYYIFTL